MPTSESIRYARLISTDGVIGTVEGIEDHFVVSKGLNETELLNKLAEDGWRVYNIIDASTSMSGTRTVHIRLQKVTITSKRRI